MCVLSYDKLEKLVLLLRLFYSPLHGGNCTVYFILINYSKEMITLICFTTPSPYQRNRSNQLSCAVFPSQFA